MTSEVNTSAQPLFRRLFSNSLWNLGTHIAGTVLVIVSAPLYINLLGIQSYGLLALLNSILAPLGLFNVGFSKATIKYVAESYGRGDIDEAEDYLGTTLLFNIGLGVLGALVIILLAGFLSTEAFEIDTADRSLAQVALRWIALNWLVRQIAATFTGVPTALQKYNIVSVGTTVAESVKLMLGLLTLWTGGDLLALVQVWFVWDTIKIGFWAWVAHRLLPSVSLWPRFCAEAFGRIFSFSAWQTVASAGGILINQTDKYLLGIYVSTEAVGFYQVSYLIFLNGYAIVAKSGAVLFPAISDLDGRGRNAQLQRVFLQSTWLLSVLMAAIMGPLFVFAHDLLRLYIGLDVADVSSQVLRLMVFTAILSAPSIGVAQYLLGVGKTVWSAVTSIAGGLVIFVGGLVLIPRLGIQGAVWSGLLAVLLSRPLIHLLIWQNDFRRSWHWRDFLTYLYGPAIVGIPIAGLLGALRKQIPWQPGWIGLVLGAGLVFLLIVMAVVIFDVLLPGNRERRAFLIAMVKQILGASRQAMQRVRL